MSEPNKSAILEAVVTELESRYAMQTRASNAARAEATDEDNRAESKYDTRGLEAGYLANGQARQAEQTALALAEYKAWLDTPPPPAKVAATGSLVKVKLAKFSGWFFIGLEMGGFEVTVDGEEITILSSESPLAQQLIGQAVGGVLRQPSGRMIQVC